MKLMFPRPLRPGSTIAITAPSSGVPTLLHPRLDQALAALRARGFRVIEGKCLRQQIKQRSASKQQRAEELMAFLTDPTIDAVIPPWGGELAIELLELIDFNALASMPAKWFSGFSDLSTVQLPLTLISGWATLHATNLMDLAFAKDSTSSALWEVWQHDGSAPLKQYSSRAYQSESRDTLGFNLTTPTQWKSLAGDDTIIFRGRLIGGCLDVISRLAGTAYADIPRFIRESGDDGVILYFENAEMHPTEFTRALYSLHYHGWFTQIRGILFGRHAAQDAQEENQHAFIDGLRALFEQADFPVLYDVDIGHVPPQLALVNGAVAQVEMTASQASLTLYLPPHLAD